MARKNDICYVNFYNAGTEALKFDPKPVQKNATLPKQRRRKKLVIWLDPAAVLGAIVAVVLLVMMLSSAVELIAIQRQTAAMEQYAAQLRQENQTLRETYEAGYDLEEIRAIAEARGMIPAEQANAIYVDVQTVPEPEEPTAWESFWATVYELFA